MVNDVYLRLFTTLIEVILINDDVYNLDLVNIFIKFVCCIILSHTFLVKKKTIIAPFHFN